MKGIRFTLLILLFMKCFTALPQEKNNYKILTVAFYNLENLFDHEDDPLTFDEDRTPEGRDHWTEEIYQKKLKNMAYAISRIGIDQAQNPPVLVGLCELENLRVLEDLVKEPVLQEQQYGIIHYDSPDRRGIDVALLYQPQYFIPTNSVSQELVLYDSQKPKKRIFTRDQLVVSGFLEGEEVHIIVNHWPSRSGGVSASSYKREQAALLNRRIIDSLQAIDPYSKIIVMGDFNDDPVNESINNLSVPGTEKDSLAIKEIFNPMTELFNKGIGSLAYRDSWNLFDQILLTQPFLEKDYSGYQFFRANVFNEKFLVTPHGQYKGYPFRSFGFGGYTGGYSDHFPVYVYLIKRVKEGKRKRGKG